MPIRLHTDREHALQHPVERTRPERWYALQTALFRDSRSNQRSAVLGSTQNSRSLPLKALLLLHFSNHVLPQTTFTSDVRMMEPSARIDDLENDLASALHREEYRTAAKLRDELKAARAANPFRTLQWEREKNLNAMLTIALSSEKSSEERMKAINVLTEMASPPMPSPEAEDALHRVLVETEDGIPTSAADALRSVWKYSGHEDIDSLLQRGVSYLEARSFQSALDTFTSVIESAPGFAEGWHKRAAVFRMMKDFDRSIEDSKQVLKLKPRHFSCIYFMGICLIEQGNIDQGLKQLKVARQVYPGMGNINGTIAYVENQLYRQSQLDTTIEAVKERQGMTVKSSTSLFDLVFMFIMQIVAEFAR